MDFRLDSRVVGPCRPLEVPPHDRSSREREPRRNAAGLRLMAAASDEQEVLKARLLAKEASLRDLTKRYLQFVNGIEGKSAEECGVLYQGLLKEIARYEFAVSKARSLIETNTRQVADYDQMRQVSEPPHACALPRTLAHDRALPAPCGAVLWGANPGLTRTALPC